jgi:hypothetical protein
MSRSISRHCASVTSLGYLFVLIPTTYGNHPLWDRLLALWLISAKEAITSYSTTYRGSGRSIFSNTKSSRTGRMGGERRDDARPASELVRREVKSC